MAAPIVQLAEDITTYLNGLSFSQSFTAERKNRVREDLSTVQDLEVWVVPKNADAVMEQRDADLVTFMVDIAVVRAATTDTEIDDMLILMDELADAMTVKSFSPMRYAGQSNSPIYVAERIDEHGVFLSVLMCQYKTLRKQSATPLP